VRPCTLNQISTAERLGDFVVELASDLVSAIAWHSICGKSRASPYQPSVFAVYLRWRAWKAAGAFRGSQEIVVCRTGSC
jgi:hypothetical protein